MEKQQRMWHDEDSGEHCQHLIVLAIGMIHEDRLKYVYPAFYEVDQGQQENNRKRKYHFLGKKKKQIPTIHRQAVL